MNILQLGYGISGKKVCELAKRKGDNAYVFDENSQIELDKNTVSDFFDIYNEDIEKIDFAVISPGIPFEKDYVQEIKRKGKKILGEIEYAYRTSKGKIFAITGTNGKTTTTSLVGDILKNYTNNSYVLGNIGIPFTDCADKTNEETIIALEVSSFQLEGIDKFKPKISAILNITEDHLNRHITMDRYSECKFNVCINQDEEDYIILNLDDDYLLEQYFKIGNKKPKLVFFSTKLEKDQINKKLDQFCNSENNKRFVYLNRENNSIDIVSDNIETKIINKNDIKLLGDHNLQNIMAAIGITYFGDIPLENIVNGVKNFKGVEHRIEFVLKKDNIQYFNDSKGTNPDSTEKAILAMKNPIILIAGGYDKNSEFKDLIAKGKEKLKLLVLMGQTKEKIKEDAISVGFKNIIFVNDMKEAIETSKTEALKYIKNGEKTIDVLLSPACASWDMYKNFEQRGQDFKNLLKELV